MFILFIATVDCKGGNVNTESMHLFHPHELNDRHYLLLAPPPLPSITSLFVRFFRPPPFFCSNSCHATSTSHSSSTVVEDLAFLGVGDECKAEAKLRVPHTPALLEVAEVTGVGVGARDEGSSMFSSAYSSSVALRVEPAHSDKLACSFSFSFSSAFSLAFSYFLSFSFLFAVRIFNAASKFFNPSEPTTPSRSLSINATSVPSAVCARYLHRFRRSSLTEPREINSTRTVILSGKEE